ncbi:MAG: 16S rRNA (guanine(527)-N(7))-methyltransferase RsmG [Candidatus Stahlbacteria bacterium]|nr:MAG: 16S rRNA (guanine(527)-N(7))-methyltransferase RsmG [Candidatus Stahlbacteria bacterium]
MNRQLEKFLTSKGIILLTNQQDKLKRYKELILDASKSINLVSRGDLSRLEELHFADSLAPLELISRKAKVADWGSGAGLPGIPLAIARPDLEVTLVESRQKKAGFLIRVKRELALENVSVFPDRGENLEERFDLITVRAIGTIIEVLPVVVDHLEEKGGVLFYKGPGGRAELDEANLLIERYGLKSRMESLVLPCGEGRTYILLKRGPQALASQAFGGKKKEAGSAGPLKSLNLL